MGNHLSNINKVFKQKITSNIKKLCKKIPLIKRLLFYILLFGISLGGGLFALFTGVSEYGLGYFLLCTYFIPQYIFGTFFLKTKLIFKFIVPFVTVIISLGSFWLITGIWNINMACDEILLFCFAVFCIVFVWELSYQILIRCLNRTANNNEKSEK